ncbi:MAG: HlyD family efflux transporter periplasmic adaptor subunit [Porticoccaceae bacterium]
MNTPILRKALNCLTLSLLMATPATGLYAHSPHQEARRDSHADALSTGALSTDGESTLRLTPTLATQAGLTTAIAGAGTLQEQRKFHGQVTADPERVRDLSARFPGVVRAVKASVGAQVDAGDILATIEANDSLRSYDIASPIDGVVVARRANPGELTGDDPLLTIVDHRRLMVDIPVFPRDMKQLRPGQALLIRGGQSEAHSEIQALMPAAPDTAAARALAFLDNGNGEWSLGEWVDVQITVAEMPVPLMVDNRALHSVHESRVVFVQDGDRYGIRPLKLGRSDGRFSEVLAGLDAGERYVVENSYLLKAELEKSAAAHQH